MTEDILFDNLYVGHSVEDAKKLAAETFDIKKPLEVAIDKADEPVIEDEDVEQIVFKEDPIGFLRQKVLTFVDAAKADPVSAFKSHPETGAAFAAVLFTLFGMIGAQIGLLGSQQTPIVNQVSDPDPRYGSWDDN